MVWSHPLLSETSRAGDRRGNASGTVISSGGFELVLSGGSALGTIVEGGGVTSALTLDQGGMLDLASIAFGSGTSLSYTSSGPGGTLTVTSGGTSLSVALFGQYAAAGFGLASDGNGGTMITYGVTNMAAAFHTAYPSSHQADRPPDLVSPPSHFVGRN